MKVRNRGKRLSYGCVFYRPSGKYWATVTIVNSGEVLVNEIPAEKWVGLKADPAYAMAQLRSHLASMLWGTFFQLRGL